MIRLIEVPGVRLLETSIASGDRTLLPGGLNARQYADQIANVNFGATETDILPRTLSCDHTDAELLEYELTYSDTIAHLRSDTVSQPEDVIQFFLTRGFDLTNDLRQLAASAPFFTRIIDAGAMGWLRPCPNSAIERWRRIQMSNVVTLRDPANDDLPQRHRYGRRTGQPFLFA